MFIIFNKYLINDYKKSNICSVSYNYNIDVEPFT